MERSTSRTLLEQLHITDAEIARRKELISFTEQDAESLLSCKEIILMHVETIVSEFYKKQLQDQEIENLIGDADTLERLHAAQKTYVIGLFEGFYDVEYVNHRLRIGMVHKRIGVEPKLYLAATRLLREEVRQLLGTHISETQRLNQVLTALDKLFTFDTTLIFDTYIRALLSEVELAKAKAESYATELEVKVAERTHQLKELSQRDPLTGIYNQRGLREFLRRELTVAHRHKRPFSLVYFDVDAFKAINDIEGHFAGDEVLRYVAQSLQFICREIDFPCRYGGDEFCVVLPECTLSGAEAACGRLLTHLKALRPNLSLSIGIVQTGPLEFLEPDQLLRMADQKMYEAKAHQGSKICV